MYVFCMRCVLRDMLLLTWIWSCSLFPEKQIWTTHSTLMMEADTDTLDTSGYCTTRVDIVGKQTEYVVIEQLVGAFSMSYMSHCSCIHSIFFPHYDDYKTVMEAEPHAALRCIDFSKHTSLVWTARWYGLHAVLSFRCQSSSLMRNSMWERNEKSLEKLHWK